MGCSCLKYRENRRLANERSDWDKLNDRVTALEYATKERDDLRAERDELRQYSHSYWKDRYTAAAKDRDDLTQERDILTQKLKEATDEWCIWIKQRDEARKQRDDLAHELDEIVAERDDLKEKLKDEEGRHQATAAAYSSVLQECDLLKAKSKSNWDSYYNLVMENVSLKEKLAQIRLLCEPKAHRGNRAVIDILKILDGDS